MARYIQQTKLRILHVVFFFQKKKNQIQNTLLIQGKSFLNPTT